ncbi:hypothetical protein HMI54_001467 [Coelomomyces lativittatus]|nr:hypothetical protein HMI54_001467 [Coelomomyces lativittatus]
MQNSLLPIFGDELFGGQKFSDEDSKNVTSSSSTEVEGNFTSPSSSSSLSYSSSSLRKVLMSVESLSQSIFQLTLICEDNRSRISDISNRIESLENILIRAVENRVGAIEIDLQNPTKNYEGYAKSLIRKPSLSSSSLVHSHSSSVTSSSSFVPISASTPIPPSTSISTSSSSSSSNPPASHLPTLKFSDLSSTSSYGSSTKLVRSRIKSENLESSTRETSNSSLSNSEFISRISPPSSNLQYSRPKPPEASPWTDKEKREAYPTNADVYATLLAGIFHTLQADLETYHRKNFGISIGECYTRLVQCIQVCKKVTESSRTGETKRKDGPMSSIINTIRKESRLTTIPITPASIFNIKSSTITLPIYRTLSSILDKMKLVCTGFPPPYREFIYFLDSTIVLNKEKFNINQEKYYSIKFNAEPSVESFLPYTIHRKYCEHILAGSLYTRELEEAYEKAHMKLLMFNSGKLTTRSVREEESSN